MSVIQSFILGCIQGVTEFLPVSSSGHLVVYQQISNLSSLPILYTIILHGATLAVIFIFFNRQIGGLIRAVFKPSAWKTSADARILLFIVIGTVPTAIIAVMGEKLFEQAFHSLRMTGFMFFITAGFLLISSFRTLGSRGVFEIKPWSVFLIGCIQGLAILPGISRSGATICLALILGWEKKLAFRFSFLLVIPAVLGALVLEGIDYIKGAQSLQIPGAWWAGVFSAFAAGLVSLYLLWKSVQSKKLKYFAYYCIVLGIAVIVISFR